MALGDGVTVRSATSDDMPAIRAVLLSVRAEFGVVDDSGVSDVDLDDLDGNYFELGGAFEVIEDRRSNRIVGCAGLRPINAQRAELCKMYIEATARGRGLGRRLLDDMLDAARRGGFQEVWLETNSKLMSATALYVRHGFRPVPSDGLLPRCDQAYLLRLT